MNDGGPAFPSSESDETFNIERGMSLRDHYAGLAMKAFIPNFAIGALTKPQMQFITKTSFDLAQMMVDESQRRT